MRFHCADGMTPIENLIPLATAVEKMGFAGYMISDSLIYPEVSDAKYSYTEDGGREFLENKPFIESFILATALLTATTTLEATTNVVKLPVRPPLYSAKMVTSIAALSGGRLNFGVGLSVWPEDYQVMGVDFAKRGKRIDECIEIVRGLMAGNYYEFHGEFYDLPSVKLNPVPKNPVPILIGGHSDAAFKRAADNNGFIYAGGGIEGLIPMVDKINGYREEAGTTHKPFRIFAAEFGTVTLDLVKRMEDIGVTDISVIFRNLYAVEADTQPLQEKIDIHARFADAIISKL